MYEIKVNYLRQTGEDNPGTVKETYLVDGATPSDAEKRLMDEIKPFIFGDCEVPMIRNRRFFDISPNAGGENWYEGKVELITVDGEIEKRRVVTVLVQDNRIDDALTALRKHLNNVDCEILAIKKSQIIDLIKE
jgi:hypothetical protein